MARIPIKDCDCIDWPCCEHADSFVYTGADAVEMAEEDFRRGSDEQPDDCVEAGVCFVCGEEVEHCTCREEPRTEYEEDTPLGQALADGCEIDC